MESEVTQAEARSDVPPPADSAPSAAAVPSRHGKFNNQDRAVIQGVAKIGELYGLTIDADLLEPILPAEVDQGIIRGTRGIVLGVLLIVVLKWIHGKMTKSLAERENEWVRVDPTKGRQI